MIPAFLNWGNMDISGRTIAITGAGRGLGAALAIIAADRGALPVLLGRDSKALDRVSTIIEGRVGIRSPAISCDLSELGSIAAAADYVGKLRPKLDVLVNSGAHWSSGAIEELTDEKIHATVASMLTGTMALTRRLLPILRARPIADIHTVVSMSGLPYARLRGSSVAFLAAKHGQAGFVSGLTEELRQSNVRVSATYPGIIEDILPTDAKWDATRSIDAQLTNREVVDAILFVLCMPASASVRSLVIERSRSDFLN